MTRRVTESAKCYVFICAGCGLLAESRRSDAVTCSTACRVRIHRSGWSKTLQRVAAAYRIDVAALGQAKAIERLSPDIAAEICAGSITIAQAQARIWPLYWAVVQRALQSEARP